MVTKVEKPNPAPAAPSDQAGPPGGVESLDDLARAGAQLEAPKVDAKAQQQVLASEAEEIAGALELLREGLIPFAPPHVQDPLALVWNDKQLLAIGKAIVELCRLHKITVSDAFKAYGPYLNLVGVLGMPALATLKLLKTPPPPPEAIRTDGQHQSA